MRLLGAHQGSLVCLWGGHGIHGICTPVARFRPTHVGVLTRRSPQASDPQFGLLGLICAGDGRPGEFHSYSYPRAPWATLPWTNLLLSAHPNPIWYPRQTWSPCMFGSSSRFFIAKPRMRGRYSPHKCQSRR